MTTFQNSLIHWNDRQARRVNFLLLPHKSRIWSSGRLQSLNPQNLLNILTKNLVEIPCSALYGRILVFQATKKSVVDWPTTKDPLSVVRFMTLKHKHFFFGAKSPFDWPSRKVRKCKLVVKIFIIESFLIRHCSNIDFNLCWNGGRAVLKHSAPPAEHWIIFTGWVKPIKMHAAGPAQSLTDGDHQVC